MLQRPLNLIKNDWLPSLTISIVFIKAVGSEWYSSELLKMVKAVQCREVAASA
jgi:hypothetical protein